MISHLICVVAFELLLKLNTLQVLCAASTRKKPFGLAISMRKHLPDNLIGPALRDDVNAVVPYFRAAPDRLYLREPNTGRTIFHLACLSPKPALLRELIDGLVTAKQPYSLDETDHDGCHPCHLCARQGHLEHLDLLVRAHTGPDGNPTFPHPLVDFQGRSVANCAKDPVEWGSYGKSFAEVFTHPLPALAPSQFCVDDIVTILMLKKPFAATPLPWLVLPGGHAESVGSASLSVGSTQLRSPGSPMSPGRGGTSTVASPLKLPLPAPARRPEPLTRSTTSVFDGATPAVVEVDAAGSSVVATPIATIDYEVGAPVVSLSTSMLQRPAVEPEAFGALLVTKDPVYVAEMILIKREIQFESEIFFHDATISGNVTLRGVAMLVDYYRPTRDPDVVLAAWRTVANPELVLFLCRRVPRPAESSTKKGRLKRVLNALEASLEIFARTGLKPSSRTRGAVASSAALDASLPLHAHPPGLNDAEGDQGDLIVGVEDDIGSDPTEEEETDELVPYTVTEASDIILATLRQRLWALLRSSVRDAIKKVYVVKRFVRRVLNLRSRCVNLFFAKLLPVLDAVRVQLATKRRILIQEQLVADSRYLALNIPNSAVYACARRCAKRKDHRWFVHAQDVFCEIAPLVVGAPDMQAALVRLLMDEWLLPTAERERMAVGSPTKSARSTRSSPRSPRKGRSSTVGQHRGEIVRCSPHSPIPYLVGSGSELRAMLLKPEHW